MATRGRPNPPGALLSTMRIVEDDAGRRHLLLKRSGESSLVRDVGTGQERYVPNDELTVRDGIDPLSAAAAGVPPKTRHRLPAVHDDRALGLLVLLAYEPRPVRTLLTATDLCESDLLGMASELRAAGLLEETMVDGERGYDATEGARSALAPDQSAGASSSDAGD